MQPTPVLFFTQLCFPRTQDMIERSISFLELIDCGHPPNFAFATIKDFMNSTYYGLGYKVTYACNESSGINATAQITCQENGEWTSFTITCGTACLYINSKKA